MRGSRSNAAIAALLFGACAALAAGCGGGSRMDAGEPKKTFAVTVIDPSFPTLQAVARPATLTLGVHNASAATIPNVAVTIDSFDYTSTAPELASNKRPIWVVEQGPGAIAPRPVQSEAISRPGGGQTAYVNTWALGPLPPGHTRTFAWHVMPVKPGAYTVHYAVAAGLAGQAKARLADGALPHGHFHVTIAPEPPPRHINPETGAVAPGPFRPSSQQ